MRGTQRAGGLADDADAEARHVPSGSRGTCWAPCRRTRTVAARDARRGTAKSSPSPRARSVRPPPSRGAPSRSTPRPRARCPSRFGVHTWLRGTFGSRPDASPRRGGPHRAGARAKYVAGLFAATTASRARPATLGYYTARLFPLAAIARRRRSRRMGVPPQTPRTRRAPPRSNPNWRARAPRHQAPPNVMRAAPVAEGRPSPRGAGGLRRRGVRAPASQPAIWWGFVGAQVTRSAGVESPARARHGAKSGCPVHRGLAAHHRSPRPPPASRARRRAARAPAGSIPSKFLKPPAATPRRFKRLIESLLTIEPEARPSAAEALSGAPWLLGYAPVIGTRSPKSEARPEKAPVALSEDEDSGSGRGGLLPSVFPTRRRPSCSTRLDGEEELSADVSDVVAGAATNEARAAFSRRGGAHPVRVSGLAGDRRGSSRSSGRGRLERLPRGEPPSTRTRREGVAAKTPPRTGPRRSRTTTRCPRWCSSARSGRRRQGGGHAARVRAQTTNAAVRRRARARLCARPGALADARARGVPRGSSAAAAEAEAEEMKSAEKADRASVESALGVEFRRVTTLADLHARHARACTKPWWWPRATGAAWGG